MEGTRKGEESGKNDLPYSAVILQKIRQFKMKIKLILIHIKKTNVFPALIKFQSFTLIVYL